MNFVVVADPGSPQEAYLARGLLRAHGIPALVGADEAIMPPTLTGRVSGTAVLVPPAHAEEARALLPEGTTVEQSSPVDVAWPPASDRSVPAPSAEAPVSTSPPGREAAGAAGGGGSPSGPDPYVPVASMRARRPRWAVVAVVLLLLLVAVLLLATTDLLGVVAPSIEALGVDPVSRTTSLPRFR